LIINNNAQHRLQTETAHMQQIISLHRLKSSNCVSDNGSEEHGKITKVGKDGERTYRDKLSLI